MDVHLAIGVLQRVHLLEGVLLEDRQHGRVFREDLHRGGVGAEGVLEAAEDARALRLVEDDGLADVAGEHVRAADVALVGHRLEELLCKELVPAVEFGVVANY